MSQFIKNLPNVQNEGVLNNVKKTAELEKRYIPFTEPQLFSRWYENKKCYGKHIMTNTKELVPFTQLVKVRRGQLVLALPQGCISCGTCSYPELTEDHVLTSAYVKIFRTVTRNAVNKSV